MDERADRVGLCRTCRHADTVPTARGAEFWRCRKSDTDPRFPKYPRLPVLECEGYDARQD